MPHPFALPAAGLLALSLTLPAQAEGSGVGRVNWATPFTSAPTDVLDDPGAPNFLEHWLGHEFNLQLQWSAASLLGFHLETLGNLDRVWVFVGAGQVSVAGGLAPTPSVLNYVGTRNDWFYDGSQGVLPAGLYDELDIFGLASFCTSAIGQSYFGECTLSPGAPLRYSFSVSLIGNPGMLPDDGKVLPLGADVRRDQVKAIFTTLELRADNTRLVGFLQSVDTSENMLSRLTLDTVPEVPEPASALLTVLGLAGLALLRRPGCKVVSGVRGLSGPM